MLLGHLKHAPHIPVSTIKRDSVEALALRNLPKPELKACGIYINVDLLDTDGLQYSFRGPLLRGGNDVQPIENPFIAPVAPSTNIGSSILVNVYLPCVDTKRYEKLIDEFILSDLTSQLSIYIAKVLGPSAPNNIAEILAILEKPGRENDYFDLFNRLQKSVSILWTKHEANISDLLPDLRMLGKLLSPINRTDIQLDIPVDSLPMGDIDWSRCESTSLKHILNTNVVKYDRDLEENKNLVTFSYLLKPGIAHPGPLDATIKTLIDLPNYAKMQYYRNAMRKSALLNFKNELPSYLDAGRKHDPSEQLLNLKVLQVAESLTPNSRADLWTGIFKTESSEVIEGIGEVINHTYDVSVLLDLVNEIETVVIPELTKDINSYADIISSKIQETPLLMNKFTTLDKFSHTVNDYNLNRYSLPYNDYDIGMVMKGHIDAFPIGIKTIKNIVESGLNIAFELQKNAAKNTDLLPFESSVVVAEQLLATTTKLRSQLFNGPRSALDYASDTLDTYNNTITSIWLSAPTDIQKESRINMDNLLDNISDLDHLLMFYRDIFMLYDEVLISLQSLLVSGVQAAFINVNSLACDE